MNAVLLSLNSCQQSSLMDIYFASTHQTDLNRRICMLSRQKK